MIYLTSDIHGAFDIHKINPDEFQAGRSMNAEDYLIICGDFGCVWDGGSSDRFWLNWLESLPWTTLFIDGNHENFSVLNAYPQMQWHGGTVHHIRSNVLHLMRGEVFEIEGKTFLAAGGGFSHDASLRIKDKTWWNEEILSVKEGENCLKNLERCGWKVDYVLSHDVCSSHPLSGQYPIEMDRYDESRIHQQKFLETIHRKLQYRAWFCGHYHQDRSELLSGKSWHMLFDTVEDINVITANDPAPLVLSEEEEPADVCCPISQDEQKENSLSA